jgi:hypothetical protein
VVIALTAFALAATAPAAGAAVGGGSAESAAVVRSGSAESFAATFEARAVGDPTIASCPGLGEGWQKIEARYDGTLTIPADERRLSARFSLELLLDRSTGIGTAQGTWRLTEPPEPDIVARGELHAVVNATEPPDPELELHGLVSGRIDPPDPDMPAKQLLGNFAASLDEAASFPHLKGSVGDPSAPASTPAALLPSVKC